MLALDLPCLPAVSPSQPHLIQHLVRPAGSLETSGEVKEMPAWRRTLVKLAEHRVLLTGREEPAVLRGEGGAREAVSEAAAETLACAGGSVDCQ